VERARISEKTLSKFHDELSEHVAIRDFCPLKYYTVTQRRTLAVPWEKFLGMGFSDWGPDNRGKNESYSLPCSPEASDKGGKKRNSSYMYFHVTVTDHRL